MNVIKAYFILNIKLLLQDKLSLLWSVLLPSVFLISNKLNLSNVLDLRFYWVYIIFNSYVFGIGLHSLRQREYGTLKTFFSIKSSKWEFFFANLFTQIVFIEMSLIIFNLIAYFFLNLNLIKMILFSNILIILMLPIAFLFFNITLLKKIHINTLSTILTIIISLFLIMLGINSNLNILNPLLYTSNILTIQTLRGVIIYLLISSVCVLTGCYSINNYSVLSNEVR